MAISYGREEGRLSVGIDVTMSPSVVTSSTTSVTLTWKVYAKATYAFNDAQTMTMSGAIAATQGYSMQSANYTTTVQHVWTGSQTINLTYGASQSRTLNAAASGLFNGGTPSHSRSITIPARPYAKPVAPSGVAAVRNSDAQATVSWTRNVSTGAPYSSITVERATFTGSSWGAWQAVATVSGTATSYANTGLSSNRVYQYRVRANNAAGSSGYASSGYVFMTPAAPTGVTAGVTDLDDVTVEWTPQNYSGTTPAVTFKIERSVNGAAYTLVAAEVEGSSWIDATPGGGTNRYRVAAQIKSLGLTSSSVEGNVVSTIVPPAAPTSLSPNGSAVDLNGPVVLSWKHNHGGDGAKQSSAIIQRSTDGGSTWSGLVTVTGSSQSYTLPGGTLANGSYLWRVQTRGSTTVAYGPFSAAATLTGSAKPVVTITEPVATIASLPLAVAWIYAQDQGQAQTAWQAELRTGDGVTLLEALSGSGAATTTQFAYAVEDEISYLVRVRAQASSGLWGDWVESAATVQLPPPVPAVVTPTYQDEVGAVVLHVDTSVPDDRRNLIENPSFEEDVEGWNTARGGISRVADGTALFGDAFMRFTADGSAGGNYVHAFPRPSVVELQDYTLSGYVRAPHTAVGRRNLSLDPRFKNLADGWVGGGVAVGGWLTAASTYTADVTGTTVVPAGTVVSASLEFTAPATGPLTLSFALRGTAGDTFSGGYIGQVNVNVPAGQTQRISTSGPTPAGTDGFRVQLFSISPSNGTAKVDKLMVEMGAVAGQPYFDGETVDTATTTYQWEGAADASTSVALVSGSTKAHIDLVWVNGAGAVIQTDSGDHVDLGRLWTQLSITRPAPAGATEVQCRVLASTNPMPLGSTLEFDGMMLEQSSVLNPYIDHYNLLGLKTVTNHVTNGSVEQERAGWGGGFTASHLWRDSRWPAWSGSTSIRSWNSELSNGSFDSNTTGWTVTSPTAFVRDTSKAEFGAASGRLDTSDAGTARYVTSEALGTGVTSLWGGGVYVTGSGSAELEVLFTNAAGATVGSVLSGVVALDGTWKFLWKAGLAPEGTTKVQLRVHQRSTGTRSMWLDLATLSNGNPECMVVASGLTPGKTYTASMAIASIGAPLNVCRYGIYFGETYTANITEDWTVVSFQFVPDAEQEWVGVFGQGYNPIGVRVDGVIVVEGDQPYPFFDGDTPDTEDYAYSWVGAQGDSHSVANSRNRRPIDSVTIERRLPGEDWVELGRDLPVPVDVVDVLPSTNGVNEYRVTAVSDAPSYLAGEPFAVDTTEGPKQWVLVNYGPDWTQLLRFRTSPQLSQSAAVDSALVPLLGRKKPVALYGENITEVVKVSGVLLYDEDAGDLDSPPQEWIELGKHPGAVCLRDFTGRRLFGTVSGVDTADLAPGEASVSFTVTSSDY